MSNLTDQNDQPTRRGFLKLAGMAAATVAVASPAAKAAAIVVPGELREGSENRFRIVEVPYGQTATMADGSKMDVPQGVWALQVKGYKAAKYDPTRKDGGWYLLHLADGTPVLVPSLIGARLDKDVLKSLGFVDAKQIEGCDAPGQRGRRVSFWPSDVPLERRKQIIQSRPSHGTAAPRRPVTVCPTAPKAAACTVQGS